MGLGFLGHLALGPQGLQGYQRQTALPPLALVLHKLPRIKAVSGKVTGVLYQSNRGYIFTTSWQ